MGEGKNNNQKQNPKLQKKTYTNTKQNKKHIEIEKLPKYVTNKILFEGKRAWIQSVHNRETDLKLVTQEWENHGIKCDCEKRKQYKVKSWQYPFNLNVNTSIILKSIILSYAVLI